MMDKRSAGMRNFVQLEKPKSQTEKKEEESLEVKPGVERRQLVAVDNSDSDFLNLKINRRLLDEVGIDRTLLMIKLATGNFFTKGRPIQAAKRKFAKSCAFFVDGRGHYTGGRYSLFMFADLMAWYMNVTFVSDLELPFERDFPNHKVQVIINEDVFRNTNAVKLDVDFIIGAPNLSGQAALAFAQQAKIPCFLYLFEPPNFIQEFRTDGEDAKDEYWENYKKCMYQCNGIVVNSHTTKEYTEEWMGENSPPISVLSPTWNERALKLAKKKKSDEHWDFVFCTRAAPFKSPLPVLKQLKNRSWDGKVAIIGKMWQQDLDEMEKTEWGFQINYFGMVPDVMKYKILRDSKALCYPSKFEGFGMPPMEALLVGTPVVAYDLPVLRAVYGGAIRYCDWDQPRLMAGMLCMKDHPRADVNMAQFSPENRIRQMKQIFPAPLNLTVGILAYDMSDWVYKAIKNASQYANQIIVVHGRCRDYPALKSKDAKTLSEIKKAKQEFGDKVEVVILNKVVSDKIELQNEIATRIKGDIYLKQDADEFWYPGDVGKILEMFELNPSLDVVKVPFIHFWKGFDLIANDAGGKWSTKHPRFWRWREGFHHTDSHNWFADQSGYMVADPEYAVKILDKDTSCYHCGYVRSKASIGRKLKFYKNRGIETTVNDTYTDWKKGDPTQPTQDVRSWAEKFKGKLPEILR